MAVRQRHPRTVGVLGGTGFVGRHLAAALIGRGYRVVVPTRHPQRARRMLILPGVELRGADVGDYDSMRRALEGCDAIVNLIGILNERGHNGAGFHKAHVGVAESMMRACHDLGIQRVVQISALKANAERGPSHYLRTKGQAEQLIRQQSGSEIAFTILRPSVIFGPDDSFINRFAALLKVSPVLPLARPEAEFSPVYVGDVVLAIVMSLELDTTRGRVYELCGPDTSTLRDIVTFTMTLTGRKRIIMPLPDFLSRLQAAICDYLVPGKPFSLDNFRSLTVASTCTENGLAALGIEARSMRTLVPDYFDAGRRQRRLSLFRRRAGR